MQLEKILQSFSRSITTSNRIAIVHHDVPAQAENIPPIDESVTESSNKIGCDIIDHELNKPQWHLGMNSGQLKEVRNTAFKKDLCYNEKVPGEDDEDSGIELGQFSLPSHEQDDNAVVGKLGMPSTY